MELVTVRHEYPELAGFIVDRPDGREDYTFLHFYNSVELLVDGVKIKTLPHACILYDKKTVQYFKSTTPLLHDWFHFAGDYSENLKRYGLCCDKVYYPKHPSVITGLVWEMETEFFSGLACGNELLESKINELFIKLSRDITGNNPIVSHSTEKEFSVLRYEMFSNLSEKWTVDDMAGRVNLSQSRFFSVYKSLYGISPIDDLIRTKIHRAEHLLTFTGKSVSEIAESLGYDNLTHFIRQFRKITGKSPSEYRKDF